MIKREGLGVVSIFRDNIEAKSSKMEEVDTSNE